MSDGSGATLLLIEDDDRIRELYTRIFQMKGYRVIEAVNGEDAVEKFKEHRDEIDLLITDVMMPNKNGRETVEEIRKIREDVKAIFTSGFNTELNKMLLSDGCHYLQKPFLPQELLQMIVEVLEEDG
jgi:two-component system, cell cycle sensor histidine kinase and response regulator CckA